jgi:carboxylate-amine ligase
LTETRFGASAPWSLGVEEELVLVDADTLDAAPAFSRVFGAPVEHVKPELFECILELTTPVVEDPAGVLPLLRAARAEAAERCAAAGVRLHAAGAHALARGAEQPIVPVPRYERMAAELGAVIYTQLVCGLHVHVSVPDPGTCLKAFEGVVPWLPVLLALSANSPYAEGHDTGRRSERAGRLLEMPTGGTPPVLRCWEDWSAATGGDSTRRHWDAWPRPEYGTLEVRVADQQTNVRRSAAFAALVQSLVATVAETDRQPSYDRRLYAQRREAATRLPPEPDEVRALADLVQPAARALGSWDLVRLVLDEEQEADRQLAVGHADGLRAVVEDVTRRSVP